MPFYRVPKILFNKRRKFSMQQMVCASVHVQMSLVTKSGNSRNIGTPSWVTWALSKKLGLASISGGRSGNRDQEFSVMAYSPWQVTLTISQRTLVVMTTQT